MKNYLTKLRIRLSNYTMLVIKMLILFIFPLLPGRYPAILFNLGISIIIILSIQATNQNYNASRYVQVSFAIVSMWASSLISHPVIAMLGRVVVFVFFISRIFMFIKTISSKKDVTSDIIIESINGYILLGIAFGLLVSMYCISYPGAFSFEYTDRIRDYYNPYYYSFITMTTVGYGDITPTVNSAKAIAVLISLVGQLYLTGVMAVLIGRYINSQNTAEE